MSSYLVNLARRSAGLACVVRANPMPFVSIEDPASTPPGDLATPREVAPAQPMAVTAGSAPAPSARTAAPVSTIVQRTLAAAVATTALPPVTPAKARDVLTAPVRPSPRIEPTAHIAESTRSVEPPGHKLPERNEGSLRTPRMIATPIVPAATTLVIPDGETPHGPAPDYRGLVERMEEASTDAVHNENVVAILPAQAVAVAPPAEPAALSQERTVHVRIGAIEIYPADSRANAQAPAVAAPAVAAGAPSSVSAGGFDEYAALRRYSPWTW